MTNMKEEKGQTKKRKIKLRGERPPGVIGEMKPEKAIKMMEKWQKEGSLEEERTYLERIGSYFKGRTYSNMIETIVLDARPLSQIAHPRKFKPISDWFNQLIELGITSLYPKLLTMKCDAA
jgi:hypothetical protein